MPVSAASTSARLGNTSAAGVESGTFCLINIKLEVEEVEEFSEAADRRSFFSWPTWTEIPVNWKSAAQLRNVEDPAAKFWKRVSLDDSYYS